jgi:colicin import membrane protein
MLVPGDSGIPGLKGRLTLRKVDSEPAASASMYDEVAQKIANVLRAAEENSVELLASASEDARMIRDEAERDAQEMRAQLEAEVAERKSESELVRAEANKYAEERRLTAERDAQEMRAQLDAEVAERKSESELVRAEANKYAEERRLTAEREARQTQAQAEADVSSLRESGEELRQYFLEASEVLARLLGESDEPELEEELVAEVRARSESVARRTPGDPPRKGWYVTPHREFEAPQGPQTSENGFAQASGEQPGNDPAEPLPAMSEHPPPQP